MVGGRGVRLRPYTTTIPKPLVPVGGELPIIEVLLRQLRCFGVTEVTLAIGHMGHLIRSYVRDGSTWDLSVDYWDEDEPLGTLGPLLQHRDGLSDDVLLLNGDLLCNLDFSKLVEFHRDHGGGLTMAASARSIDLQFGVLEVDDGTLSRFREKPQYKYLANMGIYVVDHAILDKLDPDGPHGVDDLVKVMLDAEQRPNVFEFDGYWLDIGRPEDYDRANADFADLRRQLRLDHLLGRNHGLVATVDPDDDSTVLDIRPSADEGCLIPATAGSAV